jgi:hypothetical protein
MREFLIRSLRSRSYVLDLLVALLLITTIFFLVGQQNQTAELTRLADYNKQLGIQNQELLQRVKSCTDPNGQCYLQNAKNTKVTVDGLNRVTFFSTYCASKTPPNSTMADVRKCVETAIAGKEPIVTK